ncbi:MAG: DNA-3-methyladenine glycosylase I [Bacteriovorax sp.]|nr:DNA-3-methyladenine glycosylase I [Bacteriovorax sp.]
MRTKSVEKGSDKVKRCFWAEGKEDYYVKYHDKEWGRPVRSDKVHFEFMILEGAQAGLSWATILSRREAFRKAYSDFDVNKVAKYTLKKIESMMNNEAIIRNRLKITSSVNNAKLFIEIQREFGSFNKYIWSFVGGKPIINKRKSVKDYVATSKESDALSADLKKRGFKFVGSTIMYSHMQACGLVNDHEVGCICYKKLT